MRDKDEFILVCCDENPVISFELATNLRAVCNDIHYFENSTACATFIDSVHPKQKIFLVLVLLPLDPSKLLESTMHQRQVDSIFLYLSTSTSRTEVDTIKFTKITSITTSVPVLIDTLVQTSVELSKQQELFALYNHKQKTLTNLSETSASFLWFQLFKKLLVHSPSVPQDPYDGKCVAKERMIKKCREYYRHNKVQLKKIEEFDKIYKPCHAIHWYTADSFVYKLINQALRTEDIEVLHTFRFFIVDLCSQLAEKYQEMLELEADLPEMVYRGGQLTKEDIDYLKENQGNLVAANGFLSTSRCRDVAKIYAGSGVMPSKRRGTLHAVIYELELPANLRSVIFADISYMSKMADEQEVLFDIGTTFTIMKVVYDEKEDNWFVRLTATDKSEEILTEEYIEFYRTRMATRSSTVKLGEFLIIMGQYDKARAYFGDLLSLDNQDEVHILYNLGYIYLCKGETQRALVELSRALKKESASVSPRKQTLSEILDDIGCVHIVEDQYDLSLVALRKALKMYKSPSVLNNIAFAYRQKTKARRALKYYQRALDMYEKDWPKGHPEMAITLDNIGSVYDDFGNFAKALDYHLQALQMKLKTLPEDHLDMGISVNNVGLSYDNLGDHDHALIYFTRALHIYQQCLSEIHPEVGIVLDNIGVAHCEKGNYNEALAYHRKAFYVTERALPPNSVVLAQTMKNAGIALMERGNANDAEEIIDLYRRAMNVYYANNLADACDGSVVLYNMAKYYSWQREYKIAFEHFVEALAIQQKVLPHNHPITLNTRKTLVDFKTVVIYQRVLPRNHPITLDIRKAFIYFKIKIQSPRKRKISRNPNTRFAHISYTE